MKIIAFYLPQFHETEQNNKWWGKGFTEWVNVKKAKPLFNGHNQPRVPQNSNYYNLLNDEVKEWQISLAKKNGIYGFCFYHYWFDGTLLLEKPVEQFLKNKELDISFCLSWANEPWTKAWVSKSDEILIDQKYGQEKEWSKHFYYLLPYFKDERYIKNNGKPLFVIYRPEQIDCLNDMLDYWQKLAKLEGFPSIDFAYQHIDFDLIEGKDDSKFSFNIEYEPAYGLTTHLKESSQTRIISIMKKIDNIFFTLFNSKLSEHYLKKVRTYDYDEIWNCSNNRKPTDKKAVAGAFVDWDNTARRGTKGIVYKGATPEKFKNHLIRKIQNVKSDYSNDMIFMFSWNEWAEGGYLEPDEQNKTGYLNAVKEALIETNEFVN